MSSNTVARNLVGVLDEVAVWSRDLNTNEVWQLYANNLASGTVWSLQALRNGLLH